MKVPFFIRSSLFKKLFIVTLFAAFVPIGLSWFYFIYLATGAIQGTQSELIAFYYGLFALALLLAVFGSYSFSKHVSTPLTHFIQSATEIARGNFSLQVKVESSDEIGKLAKIFNYMVLELRRLDEMNLNKIINEKNKTETILKNIADGVIVTDPQNRILLMNYVAENWFDLGDNNIANQPVQSRIADPRLLEFINDISRKGENAVESIEISVEPEGIPKPVVLQARAARIANEKQELIGIATILRDITREKEIDRMKTELVSMVAHELRSPLTCISGFTELLMDSSITRKQSEEYASIILKESSRLNDLITKFLDISKIEAGKSQIHKSPVDMRMLVEKVLDFNSQLADMKNIDVTFETPEDVTILDLDRDMMEQAILNLFSNAVKYGPEKATVKVRLVEEEENMVVEVEDTGYGISEIALPHIFEKFYRVTDNDEVRETTGSGLGLPLVKEIVEIHGGRIEVTSVVGKGSKFRICLPKQELASAENSAERVLS